MSSDLPPHPSVWPSGPIYLLPCYQKPHNYHSNGSRITFSFWQGSHCAPYQTHCHTTSSCVMASLTWDIEERLRSTAEDQPRLFACPSDCPSRSEVRNSAVGPLQHPPVPLILSKHVMFPCQGNWKHHLKGHLHQSLIICNHHKNSHLASWTFSLLFVTNPGHTYYWAHSQALTPCLPQVPSGKRAEEPRGWDSSTLYRVPEAILLYAHNFLIRFTRDLSLSSVAWKYKSVLLPTSYVACHTIWVLVRTAFLQSAGHWVSTA